MTAPSSSFISTPLAHADNQRDGHPSEFGGTEKIWRVPDLSHGVLHLNGGGMPNLTVTCMVLNATANDRRNKLALCHDELRGP
ncbi:hypothetical protein TNCV_785851 [Trichonephila clavipes]|nr:hypothetical protein TNCV_785851 [Trichonephila clavipes]